MKIENLPISSITPDDYHAKTDKIGKYMIGMSVPPKMAEQVARAVCTQWLGVAP